MKQCSVKGCNRKYRRSGYCQKHWDQIRHHGKILERTRFDPNEIIIENNICRMKLYNQHNAEIAETIFDVKYKNSIEKYKWHLTHGYVRSKYRDENDIEQEMSLHGAIIYLSGQEVPDGYEIDHKDGNKLNCLDDNLRICTSSQNHHNVEKRCHNSSGYKGVSYYKQHKKWGAHIGNNNQKIHLGLFLTIEDAARAYNSAAIKYHREFAVLNIIP